MMMSMVGKKGSMLFWRKPARYGYLADAAGIVNCALRPAAGAGFYRGARHAKSRLAPPQTGMVLW
jgi:hypothetical protein